MNVLDSPVERILGGLTRAVRKWVEEGDESGLQRWLGRELDAEGVPIRLGVGEWPRCLEVLASARGPGGWPPRCASAIEGLALAALRFARSDGRPVLDRDTPEGSPPVWSSTRWKQWYRGTGIGRVLGWWSGDRARGDEMVPPPMPTWSAPDRVLAMLRPDWMPSGDFLVVDHREARPSCRLELVGSGRTLLADGWEAGAIGSEATSTRPRPSRRIHGASADLVEWTHRAGEARITRSALLLRGRRLAMLSILVEGRGPVEGVGLSSRLELPADVMAAPLRGTRAMSLAARGRRGSSQALPIGLPCRDYETDRGTFRAVDGSIVLTQAAAGRRCWLPLLFSWHVERHRKPPEWRVLTVSERSRRVGADRAFAARVSWGRGETYVIYRSLGPPARRAFLGHQTGASFLFASFDEDGDLTPILAVE